MAKTASKGLVLLLALAAWNLAAFADPVVYTWYPVGGGGFVDYANGQSEIFRFDDGGVSIGYNPSDIEESGISASAGSAGFGVVGDVTQVIVGTDEITFEATDHRGGMIGVSISGDPGPLNPEGLPETLDGFLGQPMSVSVYTEYYHAPYEFTFSGRAGPGIMPEPSGLLMLALGIGGATLGLRFRQTRHLSGGFGALGGALRPRWCVPSSSMPIASRRGANCVR
jgi:hypothetical protein